MEDNLKEKLNKFRPYILWVELGALLHDLGKLSKAFIEYRKSWHADPKGWDEKDPHDHNFLERDHVYETFPQVKRLFESKIQDFMLCGEKELFGSFSIERAIHEHTNPNSKKGDILLINMLRAADGVDAAIDRNNPLFSAEQCDRTLPKEAQDKIVFRSNVYGFEGKETLIDVERLDTERENLYKNIGNDLELYSRYFNWDLREKIFKSIKQAFSVTVSDSTRPANDTTLWEHCYAVATLIKVILAHYTIYRTKLDVFHHVFFGIFGVGWDGLRFITPGHKIADIVSRKQVIERVKKEIRKVIEYDILLGNCIYEDLNGIYFLVPALEQPEHIKNSFITEDGKKKYEGLLKGIKQQIYEICADQSEGELYPYFSQIDGTSFMTQIVKTIKEIKKQCKMPIGEHNSALVEKVKLWWAEKSGYSVCPVCQKRPVSDKEDKICSVCLERRRVTQKQERQKQKGQEQKTSPTLFLEEITDKNNRVALIVACFSLDEWLGGKMIRSLFVSPTMMMKKEVEDLGNTTQFRQEELEIKHFLQKKFPVNWSNYHYERIKEEINLCHKSTTKDCSEEQKKYAKNVLFLYAKRIIYDQFKGKSKINQELRYADAWTHFLNSAKEEHKEQDRFSISDENLLINILLSKTPTPSTVLDVWQSTEVFFKKMVDIENQKENLLQFLEEKKRPKLTIDGETEGLHEGATYEGEINGERVEVVWQGENTFWVINKEYKDELKEKWQEKNLQITESDTKSLFDKIVVRITEVNSISYLPYREIVSTPVLFMVLVPGSEAIKITRFLHQQYVKHFGKVTGRLPFSIGNIFFYKKIPMFVVLDTARRMVENFEKLHKKERQFILKNIPPAWQRTLLPQLDIKVASQETNEEITWQLPLKLGDCSIDHFHPYMMVEKNQCNHNPKARVSFLPALDGSAIHISELEQGDVIKAYPNYYDFEFLDTTTRRFDIQMKDTKKREHSFFGKNGTRPYLLEQLPDIQSLWQRLKSMPDLTDTKLKNIEMLLQTKIKEWQVTINKENSVWEALVDSMLKKEFGLDVEEEEFKFFKKAILTGLFLDCLELHLKILKQRIKEG